MLNYKPYANLHTLSAASFGQRNTDIDLYYSSRAFSYVPYFKPKKVNQRVYVHMLIQYIYIYILNVI